MIVLRSGQVEELLNSIEESLSWAPCDHSLRKTLDWAKKNGIASADLIDILDENGCFCDCEVLYNLPEGKDLTLLEESKDTDIKNPFKLPANFQFSEVTEYRKALVSIRNEKMNCYAPDEELLVPAPFGSKPRKRIRKAVHFFNGNESELPSEIGFVQEISPVTAGEFAKKIRNSKLKSFGKFTERDAAYFLSRVEKLEIGKAMGTYFMEKNGIGGKKIELRIHKVILKRK